MHDGRLSGRCDCVDAQKFDDMTMMVFSLIRTEAADGPVETRSISVCRR